MPSTSEHQAPAAVQKPAIVINDITKSFTLKHNSSFKEYFLAMLKREKLSSHFNAVDGVTLEVPPGQSIALMGRNGSGKSTTLKMLSGVMRPDSGWVRTRGRVAGLIEVSAGFNPNLTGRDNVYLNAAILGMSKKETDARFDDILEFSEIGEFIDTEVKHYSSGMQARLGFSVAVHTEVDVLLIDEVLSVGDAAFRKKCAARMQEMRARGTTMFVVSHSATQVKQLCDRGVVLHQGRAIFDGPIDEALKVLDSTSGAAARRLKQASKGPFDPQESLERFVAEHPDEYGALVGGPEEIEENGGGLLQRCGKGVVLTSTSLKTTQGLRNGAFQRAYAAAGGPAGEWGFLAGRMQSLDESGRKSLRFQHGTAFFSPDSEVEFIKD